MSDLRKRMAALTPAQREALLRRLASGAPVAAAGPRLQRHEGRTIHPASAAQAGIWFVERLHPGSRAYTGSTALRLSGPLDVAALRQSFDGMFERHESLRTTFEDRDGHIVQRVHPPAPMDLPVIDVSTLPERDREAAARTALDGHGARAFDLAAGPLLRAVLVRLGENDHVLQMAGHHIILDGWSREILARELSELYSARVERRPAVLPELPIQFGDYAEWQRAHLTGGALERGLSYWRQALAGARAANLASDRPRRALPPAEATERLPLSPSLAAGLRALGQTTGSTLFMTMLAAFQALLFRYTGQRDLAIGSPTANRTRPELEPLIGLFANLVVLRARISGSLTGRELLSRVRDTVLSAYEHQDVPFERVVEAVRPEREAGINPLVQMTFALQEATLERLSLAGIAATPFGRDDRVRFDLELHVWDRGTDLELEASYDAHLFDAGTVERLLRGYSRMLSAVVAEPDRPIDALPLLDDDERARVVVEWNATTRPYPDATVSALFEARVAERPGATALEWNGERLTYLALNERANRLAHALRAAGVGADTVVGVCLDRGFDLVAALLGILKAGAAYLALDPGDPPARLAALLADSGAALVVTDRARAHRFAGTRLIDIANVDVGSADNPAVRVSPEMLAYVAFTSGSTGRPKGVAVPHRAVVRLLFGSGFARLGPDQTHLQMAPVGFDASTFEIWGALLHGGRLVVYPERVPSPAELGAVLAAGGVTTLWLTSSLYNTIVDRLPGALAGVRQLLVGGEALSVPHVARGLAHLPETTLINGYGPTENTTFSCCYTIPREMDVARSIPLGRPIGNTQAYVLDAAGHPVPVGVPGELHVGGAGLARGYVGAPRLTAERFVPDGVSGSPGARLYRTGDQARWRPDGTLEFLGRRDGQIKLRGFRIELGELEAALTAAPGVLAAAAALHGAGDDRQLVAYVVPAPGNTLDIPAVRAALQQRVPAYMMPGAIVPLEALPLNANGKVNRAALPDPHPASDRGAFVAPRGRLEAQIAGVWREVLGLERVGARDNFFDIGGHSLRLLRVQALLEPLLQRPVPLVTLFEYPTIEGLAEHLAGGDPVSHVTPPSSRAVDEAIAVIGMAGRFPGAPDIETFWANLRAGVESIRRFTPEELARAGVPAHVLEDPAYVPARGALEEVDLFDASLFGYSPREAAQLDPQHRLMLECAWEALERAGYAPGRRAGLRVGVYAGSSASTYLRRPEGHDPAASPDAYEWLLGTGSDFLASRISYKLQLTGPAVTVQTACSTSLVAVHTAAQALRAGDCDVALAGGVSVTVPVTGGYRFTTDGICSPDGHCRPFDAQAAGTVGGNGAGVVVLKRLSQALADGDLVHAVIRGTAVNNDGADKVGFTAPGVTGQAAVIAAAHAVAGVAPDTITFVEAHGTGTALGDPVEVAALRHVFGDGAGPATCALASVKGNVGHLDAAAGVTGLIKTVLALEHREVPPSLHFTTPNPQLDLGPFHVPARLTPWTTAGGAPRRAGVSSFGMGGTNVHAVLEEAPPRGASDPGRAWHIVPVSAQTVAALETATDRLACWLDQHPDVPLADAAYTQQIGRAALGVRRAAVGRDTAALVAELRSAGTQNARETPPPLIWLFPGQGTQLVDMARALYETEPVFRGELDACAEALAGVLDDDLRAVLYPGSPDAAQRAAALLAETCWTQVALVAVEVSLAALWRSWGLRPAAVIGHSVGELAAASVAGVLPRDAALRLTAMRGRLMQNAPRGGMVAVAASAGEMAPRLTPGLWLAAINASAQCVIAGTFDALEALEAALAAEGRLTHRLPAAGAFHSGLMAAVVAPLVEAAEGLPVAAPSVPWVSSLTGEVIAQPPDAAYWGAQVTSPVQWASAVAAARVYVGGAPLWLELGPGHTLTHLVRAGSATGERAVATLDGGDAAETTARAIAELWAAGADVDWAAYHAGTRRHRVVLPTYPFQRRHYWQDSPPIDAAAAPSGVLTKDRDISRWFHTPAWIRTPLEKARRDTGSAPVRLLVFADRSGVADRVISNLAAAGHTPIRVDVAERFARKAPTSYALHPEVAGDYRRLIEELESNGDAVTHVLQCWGVEPVADPASEPQVTSTAFLATLYLVQALEQCSARTLHLLVATTRAQDITGAEALRPEQAAIGALCRVISQELPRVRCRSVDVCLEQPDWAPQAAGQLARELLADRPDAEVAYRHGHRLVQQFTPRPLGPAAMPAARLREGSTYLITGGLGRIGLELAEFLARTVRARLVLVGRTPVPPREAWDAWIAQHGSEDGTSAVVARIRRIESLGGEVLIAAADASDAVQMRGVIETAERQYGEISGVIHAAALTSGPTFAPLAALDRDAVDQQFRSKAAAARVLGDLLAGRPLDFCVLMSSLSTVLGGLHFGAYAGANAFLDAFAALQTRTSGVPWISIGWDGWRFGEADAVAGSTASLATTPSEGVEVFARVMDAEPMPRVVVSTANLQRRIDQWVSAPAASAAPASPVRAPAGKAEEHSHAEAPARSLEETYVAPRTDTERAISAIWSDLLGIARVGVNDDFFALGGHSLLGTRVMSRVRDTFGVDLSLSALFASPNVAGLSAGVDRRRAEQAPREKLARMARRIESLSARDRERLLRQARETRRTAE